MSTIHERPSSILVHLFTDSLFILREDTLLKSKSTHLKHDTTEKKRTWTKNFSECFTVCEKDLFDQTSDKVCWCIPRIFLVRNSKQQVVNIHCRLLSWNYGVKLFTTAFQKFWPLKTDILLHKSKLVVYYVEFFKVRLQILIIYMKKLLDSDWLRAVQFSCNTSAKSVTPVQKV